MGVIVNIDMPKSCRECFLTADSMYGDSYCCLGAWDSRPRMELYESQRHKDCPIVTELPKGHGRLIDADAFQKYCFNKNFERRLSEEGLFFINLFLSDAPTILEADKESENGV